MKKFLLFLATILQPMVASAAAVEIDGIYYNLVSKIKEAEVTKNPNKYSGTIIIPEIVTYNGIEYRVTSIGTYAFDNCNDLTSVFIGNNVTTICDYAFYGCSNGLSSVTIPNSVTSIGVSAFGYCNRLTSVTIGNGVTFIDKSAFFSCDDLNSVHINDLEAWCKISFNKENSNPLYYAHHLFLNGVEIKDLVIPNSVTSIGYCAFYGCRGITSVTIPNSVTSIGEWAFNNCSSLTSVTIPNSVTSIGNFAFNGCSSLTSVTIPNSVTSIGANAFAYCSALTSITIPNSVTSIGAFSGCSSLTSVTIPNSVTIIGASAFAECSSLTSITIPNSVAIIEDGAFNSCTSLLEVTIGTGIKFIGDYTFYGCSALLDVYCYSESVPETSSNAFTYSYPDKITLHVPASSIELYKYKSPWIWFKEVVALTENDPKPTGVNTIEAPNNDKHIIYDLNGHRVEQLSKGLYIKNGKKYIVK